jgi:hypothetical protein
MPDQCDVCDDYRKPQSPSRSRQSRTITVSP